MMKAKGSKRCKHNALGFLIYPHVDVDKIVYDFEGLCG
jgi:hypothetical protein